MSKIRVIWQFVLELLIVCLIGLLIGAGIGSASSVNIANILLENEIQNTQSQVENIRGNFGADMSSMPGGQSGEGEKADSSNNGSSSSSSSSSSKGNSSNSSSKNKFSGVTTINKVDDINAVVDFLVLGQLLAIGLLLTLVSSLAACIAIARFSPLEILRERS